MSHLQIRVCLAAEAGLWWDVAGFVHPLPWSVCGGAKAYTTLGLGRGEVETPLCANVRANLKGRLACSPERRRLHCEEFARQH